MQQTDDRGSLSSRLSSLFPSHSTNKTSPSIPSPGSSSSIQRRSLEHRLPDAADLMRSYPRTRPPSPAAVHGRPPRSSHSIKSMSTSSLSESRPQSHPSILRWLTSRSTPPHSRPNSPPHPDSPSSPSFSPLDNPKSDILHFEGSHPNHEPHPLQMPSRPEAARLPPAFQSSRPPHHLSSLVRSALPMACVSPLSPSSARVTYVDPFEDPFAHTSEHHSSLDLLYSPTPTPLPMPHSPPPAHLPRSSPFLVALPQRSSIDTLRSIHEKGKNIHTSAPSQLFSNFSNPLVGWFTSENAPGKSPIDASPTDKTKASSSQAQGEDILKNYIAPKHPLVFCHGLLGFDTVTVGLSIAPVQVSHWRGIKDALESLGVEVLITRVPATSSPIDRAKVLEKRIGEVYPGRSVHLIGHSMGGIDCRYLTTHLTERKFNVLSVTTISSPHRGSSFAGTFLEAVGRERMPSVLSLLDLLPNGGGDGKAFEALTVENMSKFNDETPDVPGVKYFSWGAVYEPGMIDTWKWSHSVVLEKEGPNDGLVSLQSAQWGTYLGTLEGVNHLDLVGWVNTARYKWAEIMGREIKFKPATFYLSVADHLARVVEEQEFPIREGAEMDMAAANQEEGTQQERERAEMARSLEKGEGDTSGCKTGPASNSGER